MHQNSSLSSKEYSVSALHHKAIWSHGGDTLVHFNIE